ncbi:MAG TPA: hypothetical protein VFC44_13970 [Candidatus Saccharimonadales bacterium]|nr:hypothetical protein [Candidatus Saccharimonadales bacterium]
MSSRLLFTAIVAFWLVMNYLLWRSQAESHTRIGNAIPVQVVWEKILTAPDNSSLDIYDHDKKIGLCHWVVSSGRPMAAENKSLEDDYAPDGALPPISGYNLSFEGNTSLAGTNRVRFEFTLRLATNQVWQDFHLTLRFRPTILDIRALAAPQKIILKVQDNADAWQKIYKFSELQHPDSLLEDLGAGPVLSAIGASGLSLPTSSLLPLAEGIRWEAHEDWMQFGHSRVRVFRLETQLVGQHFYLFISRAGEILWAEGPNKITFRNDAFSHF